MAMVRDPEDDRSSRRWRWILLAVVGILPFAAIGLFVASFDPEMFKPQILAAVKQATGRDLLIDGKLHLTYALRPTIAADQLRFANAPGGTRAQMLRLERIEARIALLPLLQHQLEIDSLDLVHPDVLLETDAQGRGNWQFAEASPSPPPAGRVAQPGGARNNFFVRALHIDGGTLTWRDGRSGTSTTIGLRRVELQMESATAPIGVAVEALWNDAVLSISGQVGSLSGLQGQSAVPWPLRLVLATGEAKVNVSGVIASPAQGKGYQIKLEGNAPALAALAPFLPGVRLPPLRDVAVMAELTDRGTALPDIAGVSLRAGPSDLAAFAPGLKLTRLEISAPRLDQPVRMTAEGSLDGEPVALLASIGAPAGLLPGGSQPGGKQGPPVPLDMAFSAAGARITAKGHIGDLATLSGVDLATHASIPDLAALGRLGGMGWPALKDVALQARLLSPAGGLRHGMVLKDIVLGQPAIDLAGDIAVGLTPQPNMQGNLVSRRIDLDALRAAIGAGQDPWATPRDAPANARSATARAPARYVIPDDALPFALLRLADGDLQWKVGELIRNGDSTRDLTFRLALNDGRLKLDPFAAELPAGHVTGSLEIDATRPAPTVALVLRSPALDIRSLYHALGREGEASGTVELDLDLHGQGLSAHDIAATADGHLGMAVVGGTIDNRILSLGLLGEVLRGVNQGDLLGKRGTTQVRCFALRMDMARGAGQVRALLVDASTLLLEGGGGLNFGDETLALRLRAQPRLLGFGLVLPLRVGGSFATPHVASDPGGAAGAVGQTVQGTAETAAGVVGSGVGAVGGALGLGGAGQALAPPDACAAQLAIARGGRAGTVPAAAASGQPSGKARANPLPNPLPNPLQRLFPR